jgi:hypothetical protein
MQQISGGCLCGNIRYTIKSEPKLVAQCHCKNCQRQSGSAFSVNMMVPISDFQLMGKLKVYADMNTGSGKPVYRGFCPECGSPIKSDAVSAEGFLFVKAGTLDDLAWDWLNPTVQIYCDSRQPWIVLSDNTRNIAKGG